MQPYYYHPYHPLNPSPAQVSAYQNLQYSGPQAVQPVPVSTASTQILDVKSTAFWTGAAVGAGVALLVTNESVQKGVIKTFSKMMAAVGGGIEEIKEKYEDAKAEVEVEDAAK